MGKMLRVSSISGFLEAYALDPGNTTSIGDYEPRIDTTDMINQDSIQDARTIKQPIWSRITLEMERRHNDECPQSCTGSGDRVSSGLVRVYRLRGTVHTRSNFPQGAVHLQSDFPDIVNAGLGTSN
jgi:hypothetical protein